MVSPIASSTPPEPFHRPRFTQFNLAALTRPINWELIAQQCDELIKFATALRLGTADAESILRRFTKNNAGHPTYKALCELGRP
jgi:TnpA family transposase